MTEGLLKGYTKLQATFRQRTLAVAGLTSGGVGLYLDNGFFKGLGIGFLGIVLLHALLTDARR